MEWLEDKIVSMKDKAAFIFNDEVTSYKDIQEDIIFWDDIIYFCGLPKGAVVSIEGVNSPSLVSAMISLVKNNNIIVPINTNDPTSIEKFVQLAQVEYRLDLNKKDAVFISTGMQATHQLYNNLKTTLSAGLVLFSSGTSGVPKVTVLNFDKIINKYKGKGSSSHIISFLGFDHIGGINTIFHTICTGGTLITPYDRTPVNVLGAVQRWGGTILPTTPTFLNMLLMSGLVDNYDLTSLKTITYGTEPMPPATLRKLSKVFPNVKLKQTYGLSEVGILPTKSKSNDELWLKIGGNGFEYKIKEDVLWIRSDIAMLGYLNAESPFDNDGYFNTQDIVEFDENREYLKILGRKSEIINVGGEKVYPSEVENVIIQVPGVNDAVVIAMKNPVTGMAIKAIVTCNPETNKDSLKKEIIIFCRRNLSQFKIPMVISFATEQLHSERFKKKRKFAEDIAA